MKKELFIREDKIKWMPEYNKTKNLLPKLKKQPLGSNLFIHCNSMLINFHNNMTAADRIISSKKPNKVIAKSILLKLKQVEVELERLKTNISTAQHKAHNALLAIRRMDTMKTTFDKEIEEAKAEHEEAKEQFKLAINILCEHLER